MAQNDLKGLQMSLCVSNKLSEVIWSHLSHEATMQCWLKMHCPFSVSNTTDDGDSVQFGN